MPVPAHVKYIGLSILFVLAAINFTRTTLSVVKSSRRLDELKGGVILLEDEKAVLVKELEYKKTADYIEREARNKLNLAKPGEQIFVAPEVLSAAASGEAMVPKEGEKSNPQLWLELFF